MFRHAIFFSTSFILLLFIFPVISYADGVLLEGGVGVHHSGNTQAGFIRYQKDASALFGLDSFWDFSVASWNGPNHNDAMSITRGIRWNWTEKTYSSFEAGGAYLKRTTDNLGTRLQFTLRGSFGLMLGAYDISVGYIHFSNGKGVFQWTKTPNLGENFFTLQIGRMF